MLRTLAVDTHVCWWLQQQATNVRFSRGVEPSLEYGAFQANQGLGSASQGSGEAVSVESGETTTPGGHVAHAVFPLDLSLLCSFRPLLLSSAMAAG